MKPLRILVALIEDYVPAVLLGATTLIVMVDVVGRYVFNHPFIGVSELALIGMVWLVFLGATGVMQRREHIALELFIDRLSPRGQAIADTIVHLILSLVLGTLLYLSIKFVTTTVFSNLVATGLSRRFMATSLVIMVGFMLAIVSRRLYLAIRGAVTGEYQRHTATEAPSDVVPSSI